MQKVQNYRFSQKIFNQLNKLSILDNYHVVLTLVQDWGIILLSIWLTERFFFLYPLCLIIIGSRQRALSTIFHDATHGRAAQNKKLNFLAGTIFSGYWLFLSFYHYKMSHVKYHHLYLGNKDYDPDFKFYIETGLYKKRSNLKHFFIVYIICTVILLKVPSYLYYLIKNRALSIKIYPLEFLLTFFCWTLTILVNLNYGTLHLIILYWLVPFLTTYMVIGHFIEIAEHYPLLGASNNVLFLCHNRFSHWLESLFFSMHNENYHLVHHLRPDIPFWNMVKAHNIMLQDETYREINKNFGGIFLSSNKNFSLFNRLISHKFSEISNFENFTKEVCKDTIIIHD